MKLFSLNWKSGLALVICVVAGILGRCSANYKFNKEFGRSSSVMKDSVEDTSDNLVYVYGKLVDMDSIPDNIVYIDGKLVNKDTKKVYSSTEEIYSDNP